MASSAAAASLRAILFMFPPLFASWLSARRRSRPLSAAAKHVPGLHDQICFPSSSFLPSLELRPFHSELAHPEWARYLEGD
jgi:hypothetical protein